jgi:hypothetical protein
VRFIEKTLCGACVALLAACAAPDLDSPSRATVAGTGAQPATVAGARPTGRARDWTEYKLRAARRIHEASPGETFAGPLPDPLQSIPVLQVNLNRDGSVRDISVLRTPRQSPQTLEMAVRAIRRAAPFEPVGHLPRPWQFSETFLYNDDLKFQLRTLVEAAP